MKQFTIYLHPLVEGDLFINVLAISSNPRRNGNSCLLAEAARSGLVWKSADES
jgi:hypothetical protein